MPNGIDAGRLDSVVRARRNDLPQRRRAGDIDLSRLPPPPSGSLRSEDEATAQLIVDRLRSRGLDAVPDEGASQSVLVQADPHQTATLTVSSSVPGHSGTFVSRYKAVLNDAGQLGGVIGSAGQAVDLPERAVVAATDAMSFSAALPLSKAPVQRGNDLSV